MPVDLVTFVGVSLVVIVTPGQDTALTIRSTLSGGRRAGIATAFGVSAGQAVWALATSIGLAALIVASEPVFLVIRIVGAAYLFWLGGRAVASAIRGATTHAPTAAGSSGLGGCPFRQGLLSNLSNPKMAVFFTSLLPQFATDGSFVTLLALGLVFSLLTLSWLTGYAFAVARLGDVLRRTRVRRALDALMGAVFVALGLRLATNPR
jgi:threonine/homoserine/homoserine lactone efflux protein